MNEVNKPLTAKELADSTGKKERYVKEWLGGMVASKVIMMKGEDTYYIPDGHFSIIRANASLGEGLFEGLKAFDKVKGFFEKDGKWEYVDGFKVLDVGCGTGVFTIPLKVRFPKCTVIGQDICEKALITARNNAASTNLDNIIYFENVDVLKLPDGMENTFDFAMIIDTLHDFPDAHAVLKGLQKVMKPDGWLMICEGAAHSNHSGNVGNMIVSMQFFFSLFYCLPNSLSKEPRHGYGRAWGQENVLATVEKYFTFHSRQECPDSIVLYFFKQN